MSGVNGVVRGVLDYLRRQVFRESPIHSCVVATAVRCHNPGRSQHRARCDFPGLICDAVHGGIDQRFLWLPLGLLVCFVLAACATSPVLVSSPRTLNSAVMSRFELDGRLAIRSAHEAGQVHVHWLHDGQHDELTVSSPLGQTEGVLIREGETVRWVDDTGHSHPASSMDALSVQWLGWKLPLQSLHYWVAGAAQPDIPFQVRWHNNELELQQAGWSVHFVRWQDWAGHSLPGRLDFAGEGVSGRLLVSDWRGVSW